MYSLLLPEFNNISVSPVAPSCPGKKSEKLKNCTNDALQSKAHANSQQTENKEKESESINSEEIVVTRTSISQELVAAGGETHAAAAATAVENGSYRNAERLLRAKQCPDVLTRGEETRSINNSEEGSVS